MSVAENNPTKTVAELENKLAEMAVLLAEKDAVISQKSQRIDILEEYVRLHKLKQFGRKSEAASSQ